MDKPIDINQLASSELDNSSEEKINKDEIIRESTDNFLLILNPIQDDITCLKDQNYQLSQEIQRIKQEHTEEQKGWEKKLQEIDRKLQQENLNFQELNRKNQNFESEKQFTHQRLTNLENQNQKLIEIVDLLQRNNKNNYQPQLNLRKTIDQIVDDELSKNTDFDSPKQKIILGKQKYESLETQKEIPTPKLETKTSTTNMYDGIPFYKSAYFWTTMLDSLKTKYPWLKPIQQKNQ